LSLVTDSSDLGPLSAALRESVERFAAIADAMPQLVWVAFPDGRVEYYNRRWVAYTGLTTEETNHEYGSAKGTVHPDDLPPMWERWTNALAGGTAYEIEYRLREAATGLYRWFIARATPVRDENGAILRWIGTCTDVDDQRRARDSLALTAQASEILFASFDVEKAFVGLCELIVSRAADIALVLLADDDGRLRPVATAHRDPERGRMVASLRGERVLTPDAERNEWQRLREGRPRVIGDLNLEAGRGQLWPYLATAVAPLHPRSSLTIPLHARGITFGGLYLFYGDGTRMLDERDVPVFEDIGRRASIAMENAKSFERERRIAETLQRAALPLALARLPGLHLDAIFQPGAEEAEIGGDWYDSVLLRDGSLLVDIGDVMGRGIGAAAIMSRVRQIIAVAALYERDPSAILDAADHIVRQGFPDLLITAFCGIVNPERTLIRYANAGHRPPFLRRRGEIVELQSTGLPLGVRNAASSETKSASLGGADLLVLYTDGLVEDRKTLLDGEERLRAVMRSDAVLHARSPASFIRDACVREDRSDDVAILTMRFSDQEGWTFTAENAQAANDARSDFVRYLRMHVSDESAIESAELVFGELIGNVVRHASGGIDVHLEWHGERPMLHVIDRGAAFGRGAGLPNDPLSEGGRGLFIAQQLSDRLAIEHVRGYGNHVVAELRLRRGT